MKIIMCASMIIQCHYKEHLSGSPEFVNFTCPLLECYITTNSSKNVLTADATAQHWGER